MREETYRYDCESAPFTNVAIKQFTECGTITGSSYCSAFESAFVRALTNVKSDRGFESWPEHEFKPPECHSSLEAHGQLDFTTTGHIIRRRADVTHPRPGSYRVIRPPTITDLIFVRALRLPPKKEETERDRETSRQELECRESEKRERERERDVC